MKRVIALATVVAAVSLAAPAAAGTSKLDGRWRWSWSVAELTRGGSPPAVAKKLAGPGMVEFRDGRVYKLDPRTGRVEFLAGSFTVAGNVVTFRFRRVPGRRPPPGIVPGRIYQLRWSIYRDRLTWSELPGREELTAFPLEPWIRVH